MRKGGQVSSRPEADVESSATCGAEGAHARLTKTRMAGSRMSIARRSLSEAEHIYLAGQVDSRCPLCSETIFYTKGARAHKGYEVAHIYPLNPTAVELDVLKQEDKLSADPNHINNLIPLCPTCHSRFDKPRTTEEYRELLRAKRECIARSEQHSIQAQYRLETDIATVVRALYETELPSPEYELALDPKDVGAKLNDSMSRPTQRKVKRNVSDYFLFIRERFRDLEREAPGSAALIAAQVKAFYLAQKKLGLDQQEIFINVVAWIVRKAGSGKLEAAEIIASFYVQNCEIFE